jgi:hypothetical protein
VVEKFVRNTKREISIDYIQKVVSDYFQMDVTTLQSKTRKRHIVQARQLAMFFAKKLTKASLANIGQQIGHRDHATVLHACKTVDNLAFTDKQFRKYVEDLTKKFSNYIHCPGESLWCAWETFAVPRLRMGLCQTFCRKILLIPLEQALITLAVLLTQDLFRSQNSTI